MFTLDLGFSNIGDNRLYRKFTIPIMYGHEESECGIVFRGDYSHNPTLSYPRLTYNTSNKVPRPTFVPFHSGPSLFSVVPNVSTYPMTTHVDPSRNILGD